MLFVVTESSLAYNNNLVSDLSGLSYFQSLSLLQSLVFSLSALWNLRNTLLLLGLLVREYRI
jgi:hypothetical protein